MRNFIASLVAISVLGFIAPEAMADDGWISGQKAYNEFRLKLQQGWLPTKIECRDSKKADFSELNAEFRVTYLRTDENIRYYWGVGSSFGQSKKRAEKEGFKLVSQSSFTRSKSGLVVRCGIWHQP